MCPIEPDDLIDSSQVAQALGLTHRHSVSTYRRRYADFPRPAVTRGKGRTNLWLRSDIEAWRSPHPGLAAGRGPSAVDLKREAILDAAAELMATRPITDISVREIAARAGVPHTLIYRYIGNKQDLERAVIDRTINEVLAFTEASPEAALGGLDRLIHTLLHRQDSLRVTHQLDAHRGRCSSAHRPGAGDRAVPRVPAVRHRHPASRRYGPTHPSVPGRCRPRSRSGPSRPWSWAGPRSNRASRSAPA